MQTRLSADFCLFTKTTSSNSYLYCGFVIVQASKA